MTELVPAETGDPPIFSKTFFTNTEPDGGGADDVAKNAITDALPLLLDLIKQARKCRQRHLRVVQQCLSLGSLFLRLRNIVGVITLLPLYETLDLLPPASDRDAVSCYIEFDGLGELGVNIPAEQDDVLGRRTSVVHVVDATFARIKEDVVAREAQEPIAFAALGEVDPPGALGLGPGRGIDVEAEGRMRGLMTSTRGSRSPMGLRSCGPALRL